MKKPLLCLMLLKSLLIILLSLTHLSSDGADYENLEASARKRRRGVRKTLNLICIKGKFLQILC